jgi:hypothetical protein
MEKFHQNVKNENKNGMFHYNIAIFLKKLPNFKGKNYCIWTLILIW